ncbi:MAG: hypothetical protein Q4Q62_04700 [Thermoplasmata archaeon]|nr:hypothetical protein [Thermoplasmata archaeon]
MIRSLMSDVTEIRKIAGIEAKRVVLYTSPEWKRDVMRRAASIMESGEQLTIPGLTKVCMSDDAIKRNGKSASELAKKVALDFSRAPAGTYAPLYETDELSLLESARGFLAEEIGLEVDVYSADAEGVYDPQNKARQAAPGRPAILLE